MGEHSICENIALHKKELTEFLNSTCTARIPYISSIVINSTFFDSSDSNNIFDWCLHDDTFQPFWINVKTYEHSNYMPIDVERYFIEIDKLDNKEHDNNKKKEEDGKHDNKNTSSMNNNYFDINKEISNIDDGVIFRRRR